MQKALDTLDDKLGFGQYYPTATAVLNLSVLDSVSASYIRLGSTVILMGHANVTPTALNTFPAFRISVPILSAFSASVDAEGLAAGLTVTETAGCWADPATGEIWVAFNAVSDAYHTLSFAIIYAIK